MSELLDEEEDKPDDDDEDEDLTAAAAASMARVSVSAEMEEEERRRDDGDEAGRGTGEGNRAPSIGAENSGREEDAIEEEEEEAEGDDESEAATGGSGSNASTSVWTDRTSGKMKQNGRKERNAAALLLVFQVLHHASIQEAVMQSIHPSVSASRWLPNFLPSFLAGPITTSLPCLSAPSLTFLLEGAHDFVSQCEDKRGSLLCVRLGEAVSDQVSQLASIADGRMIIKFQSGSITPGSIQVLLKMNTR